MNDLFDELRKKIEQEAGETGISAWELAQLPIAQRQIIRHILREIQIAYPDLRRAMAALPLGRRIDSQELDEALSQLLDQAWLITMGQGQRVTYRVNLRPKKGSRLAPTIWEQLDHRLGPTPGAPIHPPL